MNRHAVPDVELRARLQERGLECHLLIAKHSSDESVSFPNLLVDELKELLLAAYGQTITPAHFLHETWAITLRQTESPHSILACTTLMFYSGFPCYFHTHFEAVHPDHQRTGLGRLLFESVRVWARFLLLSDPLVTEGLVQSHGDYCIVATVDKDEDDADYDEDVIELAPCEDNEAGHGAFLKKLGFTRAVHDFRQDTSSELAFQLQFHVPLNDWCEEQLASEPLFE